MWTEKVIENNSFILDGLVNEWQMKFLASHEMVQLSTFLQILFNDMYGLILGKMFFVGRGEFYHKRHWI